MKTAFAFDLRGVLFTADSPIPGASDVFNKAKEDGHKVTVFTNSTLKGTKELLKMLKEGGFNVNDDEIVSGAMMTIAALKKNSIKCIFCLGTESFVEEIRSAGIRVVLPDDSGKKADQITLDKEVEAVVVAQDPKFGFVRASLITRYIMENKAKFYAVGRDRLFTWEKGGYIPGPFTLAAPAETASYVKPTVIGKPDIEEFEDILPFKKGDDVVVIGDNQETDICLANKLGFKSILVLTGVTERHEITEENAPTFVCEDIKELAEKIKSL